MSLLQIRRLDFKTLAWSLSQSGLWLYPGAPASPAFDLELHVGGTRSSLHHYLLGLESMRELVQIARFPLNLCSGLLSCRSSIKGLLVFIKDFLLLCCSFLSVSLSFLEADKVCVQLSACFPLLSWRSSVDILKYVNEKEVINRNGIFSRRVMILYYYFLVKNYASLGYASGCRTIMERTSSRCHHTTRL